MNHKTYIDEKIVSEITGLAIQTLRNHRFLRKGLPYHKVGRAIRYCLDDIYSYMDSKKIDPEYDKSE
jgi:hypothetical protein